MPHILITGASRRLGLYLTEQFLQRRWQVTTLSRAPSAELRALDGPLLTNIACDYQDSGQIAAICAPLQQAPLDAVVHNASLFLPDSQCVDTDRYQQMFAVHMQLPALLNRLLAAQLAQSDNGNIIHMTDIYADNPLPNHSLYCSTKAGLANLNKSVAQQLAPKVRVNAIAPGVLKFLPEHSTAQKQAILERSLIPIEAGFAPVLAGIDYLLNNPFITGTTLTVDGGRSLCR